MDGFNSLYAVLKVYTYGMRRRYRKVSFFLLCKVLLCLEYSENGAQRGLTPKNKHSQYINLTNG